MQPVGDSGVVTHLGLHLEGLSKDNRLWTEHFVFNEDGKGGNERRGEALKWGGKVEIFQGPFIFP